MNVLSTQLAQMSFKRPQSSPDSHLLIWLNIIYIYCKSNDCEGGLK